jgi:hypothetical protein
MGRTLAKISVRGVGELEEVDVEAYLVLDIVEEFLCDIAKLKRSDKVFGSHDLGRLHLEVLEIDPLSDVRHAVQVLMLEAISPHLVCFLLEDIYFL